MAQYSEPATKGQETVVTPAESVTSLNLMSMETP